MTWKQELGALERFGAALARIGKEKSRALEQYRYGDPAKHVEFEAEIKRREAAKNSKKRKGKEMLRAKRVIEVFDTAAVDPLTKVLDIYVGWTRRDDFGNQHRHRNDEDDPYAYIQADINTAEAVHTMLWEMKEIHRWAINKRCGISSVWRFPNAVFADVLVDAEVVIIAKMKNNFATRDYFK